MFWITQKFQGNISFFGWSITSQTGMRVFKTTTTLLPMIPLTILIVQSAFTINNLIKQEHQLTTYERQVKDVIRIHFYGFLVNNFSENIFSWEDPTVYQGWLVRFKMRDFSSYSIFLVEKVVLSNLKIQGKIHLLHCLSIHLHVFIICLYIYSSIHSISFHPLINQFTYSFMNSYIHSSIQPCIRLSIHLIHW